MDIEKELINKEKELRLVDTRFINNPEDYLNFKYELRYNIITNKTEYQNKHSNGETEIGPQEIDDYKFNSIIRELSNYGIKCTEQKLHSILCSDFCEKYNPFHDYLKCLPEWDQRTDHIKEWADTINTTDDEYWYWSLKKWIVGMVGSLLKDEVINHLVLVLQGEQAKGKTRWTDRICPPLLKNYYYSGAIKTNNKDTTILMSECMLINLDELENLQIRQLGSLKNIITRDRIRLRRAYGRFTESFPHRASFIGSVNQAQFLHDTTGSRRFLCHEIENINADHTIDMNLVFSQALFLFNNEFRYWLDEQETKGVTAKNDRFEFKPLEEELLLRHFNPANRTNADAFLLTSQIMKILEDKYEFKNRLNLKIMGQVLNKHGFEHISKNQRYVRAVRFITN